MLLLIAAAIVMAIPVGILGAISPVLVFFGVMFLYCGMIYLFFGAALVFIIRAYEGKGFFEAIGRSFKLVKDKWWSTFGLIFVLYLIVGVSSYIFLIPWYVITVRVGAAHNFEWTLFRNHPWHAVDDHRIVYAILSSTDGSYGFAWRWYCVSIL